MTATPKLPVWDRFVRVFHWSLVLSFAGAWWSTEHIDWVHKGCGYAALALVLARTVWGFTASGHARFSSFVPGPRQLGRYLLALLGRREPRYLGHNPAGSVMVLFLLIAVLVIAVTGWMLTLDAFWGNGTVEDVHLWVVDLTLAAVVLHVLANVYASLRHRENLVVAMVTGRKRASAAED